jgi:hypothetical protein
VKLVPVCKCGSHKLGTSQVTEVESRGLHCVSSCLSWLAEKNCGSWIEKGIMQTCNNRIKSKPSSGDLCERCDINPTRGLHCTV